MSRGLWNTEAQFVERGYAAKALDISTPLFYPRAQEQQASLPGEQPCDADAARIHKSVRVCSHMVHQKSLRKRKAFFIMIAALCECFHLPLTSTQVSGSFCFVGEIQELLL